MAVTITKVQLSGSTDGEPIAIAASATPGTTLHTATATANVFDELHIVLSNISAAAVEVTLEVGGTAAGNQIIATVPAKESIRVVAGNLVLNNGAVVAAFAGSPNVVNATGYVNRIDQTAV